MAKGGDSGTTRTVTTTEMSPEQRQLLEPVIPIALEFLQNPPQLFPDSTIAPVNPLQSQAWQQLTGLSQQLQPVANQTLETNQALAGGGTQLGLAGTQQTLGNLAAGTPMLNQILSGDMLKAESNPYLQGAIQAATDPVIQNFQQQVIPTLRNEAALSGQLGGSRQGIAEGMASQALSRSLEDIATNMAMTNYLQGLQTTERTLGNVIGAGQDAAGAALRAGLGGLGVMPQSANLSLMPANILENVGAVQRAEDQAALSEQAQRFFAEQILPWAAAQDVAQLAFGFPGGQTTAVATPAQGSMFGNLIRGGLGGAASGASIGSAVPGLGTGLGALLGGLLGAGSSFF